MQRDTSGNSNIVRLQRDADAKKVTQTPAVFQTEPEWAKSTTCSWQKRWFLDPVPDSERQKPYPVERHIPV